MKASPWQQNMLLLNMRRPAIGTHHALAVDCALKRPAAHCVTIRPEREHACEGKGSGSC